MIHNTTVKLNIRTNVAFMYSLSGVGIGFL